MVTIKSYGEGTCIWCSRDKEGVDVETEDRSFLGFLCFNDLKRMLKLKATRATAPTLATPERARASA